MKCSIYEIYNDINDKVYVGVTFINPEYRFGTPKHKRCKASHIGCCNLGCRSPLYDDMRLYGIDKYHMKVLYETDVSDKKEGYRLESEWILKIEEEVGKSNMYNIDHTPGETSRNIIAEKYVGKNHPEAVKVICEDGSEFDTLKDAWEYACSFEYVPIATFRQYISYGVTPRTGKYKNYSGPRFQRI